MTYLHIKKLYYRHKITADLIGKNVIGLDLLAFDLEKSSIFNKQQ